MSLSYTYLCKCHHYGLNASLVLLWRKIDQKMNLRLHITLECPFHSIVILPLVLNEFPAPFIISYIRDTIVTTEHPHEDGERVSWLQCKKVICQFIWLSAFNWCQACLYKGIHTFSEKLVWLARMWGKMEGGGGDCLCWMNKLIHVIFLIRSIHCDI